MIKRLTAVVALVLALTGLAAVTPPAAPAAAVLATHTLRFYSQPNLQGNLAVISPAGRTTGVCYTMPAGWDNGPDSLFNDSVQSQDGAYTPWDVWVYSLSGCQGSATKLLVEYGTSYPQLATHGLSKSISSFAFYPYWQY